MIIKLFLEQLSKEVLLLEQFSSWTYRMPRDPELLLYDFYFFSIFGKKIETDNIKFGTVIEDTKKLIADKLQQHMLKALKYAISSELRHIFDSVREWPNNYYHLNKEKKDIPEKVEKFVREYAKYIPLALKKTYKDPVKNPSKESEKRMKGVLSGERTQTRVQSYKGVNTALQKLSLNKNDFADIANYLFTELDWFDSYGGNAWGQIADGYKKLLNARTTEEKFKWIDHAYDLQHNNDTVFNKLKRYYKRGPDDPHGYDSREEGGYEWLANALDWKRDATDIREYYKKVSPQLKQIVAYTSKNLFGKTIQDMPKTE